MDATAIRKQIENEIRGDWTRSNWHGVDLKQCLVEPVKTPCRWGSGEIVEMWLVLEECPETKDGYKIVYDEEADSYCLAFQDGELLSVWGYYGSFLETLAGM